MDVSKQRVLATNNKETTEEMVRWLERELDEEFLHLFPAASEILVSTEASEQKVSEDVTELVELEIENKQFVNSSIDLKILNVPRYPTTNASAWNGLEKVREQP